MADITGHPPVTRVDPPLPPEVLFDRLSDLPDALLITILSFLPTHMAARTSCLSRRFHRLWLASPSLHFDRNHFSITRRFVKMVNSVLLGRHRSPPLENLCIESSFRSRCPLPFYPVLCWIIRADDLGVRHLRLMLEADTVAVLFWVIFSIESLESLHIETLHFTNRQAALPVTIFSTCLKSLSLWFNVDSAYLTRLIRELPVLEYLELKHINQIRIDLSSMSVKKLKLQVHSCNIMKLCFPKLDFIHLICEVSDMEMFQGEMPLVSQAVLIMRCPYKVPTLVLESMLKSAANVVELTLSIETSVDFERIYLTCCEMQLSFPRLENFKFSCSMCFLKLFQAEMPVLRKANIQISYAKEEFTPPVSNFLKCIANVVDLKFTIRDNLAQLKPFHIFDSNKKPPLFPRLIHFELSTCCHEATIEDTISMLENCPVLNCLKMSHMDPHIGSQGKKKTCWQSKLPRNSEGNYQHACFTDLHIRHNKGHVIKQLSRRLTSKKRKIVELVF